MHVIALLATVALGGQSPLQGGPNPEDCVLTEKQAYLILPAQPVGSGQIQSMRWAPSGRYLMLVQSGPKVTPSLLDRAIKGEPGTEPVETLVVWDRQTGRTTEVDRLPLFALREGFQFFAGTDLGVAVASQSESAGPDSDEVSMQTTLLIADPKAGRVARISMGTTAPGKSAVTHVSASPTIPKIIVFQTELKIGPSDPGAIRQHQAWAWTMDAQGRATPRINLGNAMTGRVVWRRGGEVAVVESFQFGVDGKPKRADLYFDVRTGQHVSGFENRETTVSKPLLSTALKAAGSADRTFRAAWIKSETPSEQPEALLAGQADEALIAPTNDAVAIRDRGVVTVRLLAPIPKEVFLAAKAAADRAKVMARAKQLALGMLMFASDNHDRLPSSEEFGNGVLDKYLKDKGLGNGFVYMMNGELLSDFSRPAETVMGYIQGPGGYAWVFSDGHVSWKTEPPKPPNR